MRGASKVPGGTFDTYLKLLGGAFYAEKIHRGERPFGRIAEGKEPSRFLDNVGIPKGRRLAAAEELE